MHNDGKPCTKVTRPMNGLGCARVFGRKFFQSNRRLPSFAEVMAETCGDEYTYQHRRNMYNAAIWAARYTDEYQQITNLRKQYAEIKSKLRELLTPSVIEVACSQTC